MPEKEWWEHYFDRYVRDVLFSPERFQEAAERTPALIRWLSLERGDRVLDLACGIGRFALPLARSGIQVHGVDITRAYLNEAARMARSERLPITFTCEDMRHLQYHSEFDAVICMFTSFGYFEREEDHLLTLERVAEALKPGGRFLIDVVNRDILIKKFRPQQWSRVGDRLVLQEHELDYEHSRIRTRWVILPLPESSRKGRRAVKKVFSLRLFSPHELSLLIQRAGMEVHRMMSTLDGTPVDPDQPRLIILAKKPDCGPEK